MVRPLTERVFSGFPQVSVLGSLLSLIYINNLPDGIQSICKIFADGTSLFSKCHNFKNSERKLNEDLTIIKYWAFRQKMDFNPYPKKQAIAVCFSRKIVSNNPSPLFFNQSQVKISESHKDLGLILDTKLKLNEHLEDKINKCNRIIGSIKTLSLILPRACLLTIYKAFVRPCLDYADIIYDKPDNESFKDWLEKVFSVFITKSVFRTNSA